MPLSAFLMGLAVQCVVWPVLWLLSSAHFCWIVRRRRARGDLSNRGHYGEVVLVVAVISLLVWIGLYLNSSAPLAGAKRIAAIGRAHG